MSEPKNAPTLTPNGKKKALVKIVEKNGFKNSLFYSKYWQYYFSRIMRSSKVKEVWDTINRSSKEMEKYSVMLQTLWRELENMNMRENETLNKSSSKFMVLVN